MKHWKKMAASLIAISTMVAVVPTTYAMESEDSQPQTTDTATVQTTKAAEPTLLASWDFTGKNGTTNSAIADSTGKYNLTLKDGAKGDDDWLENGEIVDPVIELQADPVPAGGAGTALAVPFLNFGGLALLSLMAAVMGALGVRRSKQA